jgi:hypothetical protein
MKYQELQNEEYAIEFLANHLNLGTLTLFLGAGSSKGFGLPDWLNLINGLLAKVELPILLENSSAEELQNAADEVLEAIGNDQDVLIDMIKHLLYVNQVELELSKAYSNKLLIAISSLMIGSKRGHIRQVVTLNYDSMLEWFLSLFGFVTKSISELPALEGDEDVRIYHPHGFIPHSELGLENSDFIILGITEANRRLGTPGDPWFEKIRQILESSICLFVGMSPNTFTDRLIAPLLTTVSDKVKLVRPTGIWINLGNLSKTQKNSYLRSNVIPLECETPDNITQLLLKISQKASKKIKCS